VDPEGFVVIRGRYNQADWNILFSQKRVARNKAGDFLLKIPVNDEVSEFELLEVGPLGQVNRERVKLTFVGDFKAYQARNAEGDKPLGLSFGIGPSYVMYTESAPPNSTVAPIAQNQMALTAKAGYTRMLFPPNWDFGLSGYYTVMPLSTSYTPGIRFLGLNARVGYIVPSVKAPWRFAVMGGFYYTTTMVDGDSYGFKNMAGPQLFPVLSKRINNNTAIGGYFKFSPVTTGASPLAFNNREIAGGLNFTRFLKGGKSWNVSLDVASFALNIGDIAINSTSYSLGFGFGL
jgi:hypothetical protein